MDGMGMYGGSFSKKPVQSVTFWRTPPEHGFPRLGPNAALKQRQHFRRLKSKGRQVSNTSSTQVPSASALDVIFTHNFSFTFQRFALLLWAHVGRSEGSASWFFLDSVVRKNCAQNLANRTQTQPPCRIAELLLLLFNLSHLVNILINHPFLPSNATGSTKLGFWSKMVEVPCSKPEPKKRRSTRELLHCLKL